MLGLYLLAFLWASCSGQYRQSDFPDKPILRMGPDDFNENMYMPPPTTEGPEEPSWVSILRDNIKSAVKDQGYDDAKDSIKDLIAKADMEVNGDQYVRNGGSSALRSFAGADHLFDDERNKPILRSKWEPRWETDLKNYIKGLIGQHGKSHLDDYVRPVVDAIESSNNVIIKDIDGEVSVNWKPAVERPMARSAYQFESRPELHQFI